MHSKTASNENDANAGVGLASAAYRWGRSPPPNAGRHRP